MKMGWEGIGRERGGGFGEGEWGGKVGGEVMKAEDREEEKV